MSYITQDYECQEKIHTNYLIQVLRTQHIKLADGYIKFKGNDYVTLINMRGHSSFNASQIEFIKNLGAEFNINFNQWMVAL